ncbi:ornithine decarboxylase-like isoform X2 [Styela clava]|uniref:ornithine decarboxylase-like isoform X2 n=1 Tax=Styela clava TaxID=7725 RepID=UPI00193A1488|nr:ornithine decarboxylase-like isoform X2 [Styela clava]
MDSKIVHIFQKDSGSTRDDVCRYLTKNVNGRQNIDDSFYVFDLGELTKLYALLVELLPRVKPFYAVKASPYDTVISALMELGTGFYCGSQDELLQAKRLGVNSKKIIMANPCKQISHLQTAKKHGVKMMVFDNEDELKKLKKYHPTSRLVLRIHVQEDGKKNYFSLKYGVTSKKARDLILMAKEFHMDVVGISFHVGALLGDKSDQYKRALLDAKELFDFAEKNNISFSLLDIGGGFRVTDPFLQQTTSSINIILEELFPVSKHPDLEIISEPGAFLTDTAFTLATNVIGRRDLESTYHYYVNDGKFGSFLSQFMLNRDMGYFFISESMKQKSTFKSRVWGPVLTSMDEVIDNVFLPQLDIGDWIFWRNMGAYSFAFNSSFNGYRTKTFYDVISKEDLILFQQLRKKETSSRFCFQNLEYK